MNYCKQISMKSQIFKHILKLYLQSPLSAIRFSSVNKTHPNISNERETITESLLKNENEPVYYFDEGLRKVYPYYYHFNTACKHRWVRKNIVDALYNEYALYPKEEIMDHVRNGLLKVNGDIVNTEYVLKNGDLISSINHRHELAVLACTIKILHEDDDMLVVDKPPSIPVHSCGMYCHNTVLSMLANDYRKNSLFINYRLDRLTSGILIFSKSSEKSRQFHEEMNMRNIKKEYICRVEGNFPDNSVICNKPIKQLFNKIVVSLVNPGGKIALTEFQKLSYNGKSSVVLCKPYTGRSHQIRVHLQYLGYPIINDPVYNSFVFGPLKGKNGVIGKTTSQLTDDLLKEHSTEWALKKAPVVNMDNAKEKEKHFLQFSIFKEYYNMNNKLPYLRKDCSRLDKVENCYFCKLPTQDPEQTSLGMFLHACKYESNSWKFESDMPFWTSEDWNIA